MPRTTTVRFCAFLLAFMALAGAFHSLLLGATAHLVLLAGTVPIKLLRLPSVLERVPYSRPNIYRLMRLGKFPKPISMGGRAVAWLESDVDSWLTERVQAARESVTAMGAD